MVRAVILVRGIVQGVGYRYFVIAKAKTLNLNGYVMNLSEKDKVKIEVEGERKIIDDFIKELKKGPSGAYIDELKIEWSDSLNEFRGFDIRY